MVYLVGAGPGDPELLTIKALNVLKEAEVVIYDALVNPAVLEWTRRGCHRICVGAPRSRRRLSQEEINRLLIEKGRRFSRVVRLKCGDPLVFARGIEEARALVEAGLTFTIIPGVTAGVAAPACFGIPLTCRFLSSSVAFVTGHEAKGKNRKTDLLSLSRCVDTLVIYMGVGKIHELAKLLCRDLPNRSKPAAIIERGSWPDQKIHVTELQKIASQDDLPGFRTPALIVIGDVVRLYSELRPYFVPLSGIPQFPEEVVG